jgi:hypothetical protein
MSDMGTFVPQWVESQLTGLLPLITGDLLNIAYHIPDEMQAIYENSQPFLKFLRKQKLDDILQKTSLIRKKTHTIVPHVKLFSTLSLAAILIVVFAFK